MNASPAATPSETGAPPASRPALRTPLHRVESLPAAPRQSPAPGFARTKIQAPRVRGSALIARPALEARFAQALQNHSLVLLSAPAGFGKSSLLARQMAQLPEGTAVAWVGCDADDSPLQLLHCLVAALEPHDLPWRTDPEVLMASATSASSREARRAIVAELINALDACDVPHGLIVVDDLHRVRHGMVYQFLELLLERFTPRWTLVIASREEPPLPLARLRAAGELAEFHAADLRFDAQESCQLAARAGVDAGAAHALHVRTEGWPVGLRLALDLQRDGGPRPGAGAHLIDRRVFDFLATEVLGRLRPDLRDFLLACAVLPELTATRCAAVTGDAQAAQRLDEIDRAGLFVTPLDCTEPTWRLHELFRTALEQRLRMDQPEALPRLLQRAAAAEPDPARRIGFLLQAQDWAAAAAELRAQAPGLITGGASSVLAHLLDRFPADQREHQADLLLTQALAGWGRWDWTQMHQAAQRAALACRRNDRSEDALEAEGYALVALRASGQREASLQSAQVLEHAVAQQVDRRAWQFAPITGNEPGYVATALLALGRTWDAFDEGRLNELPGLLDEQMSLLDHSTGADSLFRSLPLPVYQGLAGMHAPMQRYVQCVLTRTDRIPGELRTLARGLQGGLRLWSGDVAGALVDLQDAAEDTRWRDHPLRLSLYVHPSMHLAQALQGERTALRASATHFQGLVQRAALVPALQHRLDIEIFTLARWLLCAGCDVEARQLFLSLPTTPPPHERPVFARQRQALGGYLALLEQQPDRALAQFEPLLKDPVLDLRGLRTELHLRVARLRLAQGDASAAADTLRPLFASAGHGAVGPASGAGHAVLWLAGPQVLRALADTDWSGHLTVAAAQSVALWATQAESLRGQAADMRRVAGPAATLQTGTPMADDAKTLSAREWDVLGRLAEGDSNKLIARAFDLSPHTVKRHVANILDKLALNSRGQAAAWYHAHAETA